jgi:hypothetical protein
LAKIPMSNITTKLTEWNSWKSAINLLKYYDVTMRSLADFGWTLCVTEA